MSTSRTPMIENSARRTEVIILGEMRDLGSMPLVHEPKDRKRIFSKQTLEAFKEVRDALKETRGTSAIE